MNCRTRLTNRSYLKPSHGYIEQVEVNWHPRCDDDTMPQNSYILQWATELMEAMDTFGRSIRLESDATKRRLADAGFVDIKEEVIRLPVNGWPSEPHGRETGRWFNLGMRLACQPLSLAPCARGRGKTPREVKDLAENVREEIFSTSVHAYCSL